MATGQNLLDLMELANQELQLQPTETDVVRGLSALNVAQDHFENLAATRKIKTGTTSPTVEVTATANVETTAFPTGLLRLDRLQRLDGTGGNPIGDLDRLQRTGGHANRQFRIWQFSGVTGSGVPGAYWTQGTYIYWSPKPASTLYYRAYGFIRATDITAGGTFTYDDGVMFPLAVFAAKIMSIGVADSVVDLTGLAQETFGSILDTLERFNRDSGQDLNYERIHSE